MNVKNRQSASKLLKDIISQEEGSTTIPRKGSRVDLLLLEKPDIIIHKVFTKNKNLQKLCCIYFLIHIDYPNYIYIGSTKCINKRLQKHRVSIKKRNHHSTFLNNVVNKYGYDNLYFGILETSEYNNLELLEKQYIIRYDSYKNGYNGTLDTSKNLITEQIIQKNRERSSKKVYMYDLLGNFEKEFSSVTSAAIFINTQSTNISKCCTEGIRFIKNKVFRYKDDIINNKRTSTIRKSNRGTLNIDHNNLCIRLTSKKVKATYTDNTFKIYYSISECERKENLSRGSLSKQLINKKRHSNSVIYEYYYEDIV
jgi:hypothetical protein